MSLMFFIAPCVWGAGRLLSDRSDISAKDTSTADFDLSVACLIKRLLCDEELFGPGMRYVSL